MQDSKGITKHTPIYSRSENTIGLVKFSTISPHSLAGFIILLLICHSLLSLLAFFVIVVWSNYFFTLVLLWACSFNRFEPVWPPEKLFFYSVGPRSDRGSMVFFYSRQTGRNGAVQIDRPTGNRKASNVNNFTSAWLFDVIICNNY